MPCVSHYVGLLQLITRASVMAVDIIVPGVCIQSGHLFRLFCHYISSPLFYIVLLLYILGAFIVSCKEFSLS